MNIVHPPFQRHHLGDMAEQIKEVIYSYADRVSVAEAIGILEIVKAEVLAEQEASNGS